MNGDGTEGLEVVGDRPHWNHFLLLMLSWLTYWNYNFILTIIAKGVATLGSSDVYGCFLVKKCTLMVVGNVVMGGYSSPSSPFSSILSPTV